MKKLIALAAATALSAGLGACSEPTGEDTADLAPDTVAADITPDDIVEGEDGAPGMVTLQLALDEACPSLGTQISSATCVAEELGGSFACDYAFVGDEEGVERSLTMTQAGDGWTIDSEPAE